MLAVSVIEHVICYKRPLICPVARQQALFCYPLPETGHLLHREGQFLSSGVYSFHSSWVMGGRAIFLRALWTGLLFYCSLVFSRVFSLPFEILERNI